MRKQTKLAVVVSAAALVAIGASMTAMAAAGWQQENGQWVYLNSNGDYVYDEWKRSGDNYFYLGSDGYMVTDSLIDDNGNYYYVDANGAMVKNDWKPVAADDSESADIDLDVESVILPSITGCSIPCTHGTDSCSEP